ncbi:hypothetical protein [Streptomyces sp. NPDC015345]|uniref:hypothetical protein n=1 Tax=Streptomyces sp. NPDC015345 TaxID=3364953 RepID=UPI0036FA50D3
MGAHADYDLSFERLADAVDASSEIRYGKRWTGPGLRMRCTTTEPVYDWPQGAPYDGEATFTWMVPGYGSHATKGESFRGVTHKALCGFTWAKVDRPRRMEGPGVTARSAARCRPPARRLVTTAVRIRVAAGWIRPWLRSETP